MAEDYKHSVEYYLRQVRVGNLPYGISHREITSFFKPFGVITNLFLKRRVSKDSSIFLQNPFVFIVFDTQESVNQVMAARPFYMGDCQLFVRRCLPVLQKYPQEAFSTVRKILIRSESESNNRTIPDDESIVEYLKPLGGHIEYIERLNDETILVEFDDYDPIDLCCLLRPHFIKDQPIEITKCINEEQTRLQGECQQRFYSISNGFSSTQVTSDIHSPPLSTTSSVPTLSIDDQITQLRSTYNDMTNRLEHEHEELVTLLSSEWEQTAKERVRLQRLTLDYKQEHERLTIENKQWQKSFSDSLKEKPVVQNDGELKLKEACEKTAIAEAKYNELSANIPQ